MAFRTDRWVGKASADWGASSSNWSAGLPTGDDNVVISTASVLTVSYGGSDTFTIHALSVGRDLFDMSGGSLAVRTTASFADGFTQTGGVFSAGGKVTVKGAAALAGGAAEGKTEFVFDGTVALANYTLGAASTLTNAGRAELGGNITLGDANGTGARIDNEKGAVFDIEGDFGIALGVQTAKFINAGTLEKTAGTGLSALDVDVVDTGKIVVAAAGTTLALAGPSNNLSGAISGAGTFELGGFGSVSDDLIGKGTTITTAAFTISFPQTVVTLGEDLGYAGAFTTGNAATIDLAGFTLSLAGTSSLSWGIEGPGTLVTTRGSTTTDNQLSLGGGIVWENSGTVSENTVALQLGDATSNPAVFMNEKSGTYQFAADVGINIGTSLGSLFDNFGTLEKTSGTGVSLVYAEIDDSGRIIVKTGTIEFVGLDNSFAGKISGAGAFVISSIGSSTLDGGVDTIGKGTTISTASFTIIGPAGTFVILGEKLAYAGTFALESAIIDLDGFGLTLSRTATFVDCLVEDEGTLVTTHGTATSVNGMVLAYGANWQNSGVIDLAGTMQIGDDSYVSVTLTNEKGGVFDVASDGGITLGGNSPSRFVNAAGAVFEKTVGTGDSTVGVAFTNNGWVKVENGEIEFQNAVTGSGSFRIAADAVLQFDGTVAAGSKVEFAGRRGGELVLADGGKFAAGIHGFGGKDEIALTNINIGAPGFKLSYHGNAKEGVLTVTDGAGDTARLTFFGDYKRADFHASANPAGGTLITDPLTHAFFASAS